MPKDADWHYPALDHALADSRTLYIEVTDDDPASMAALVFRHGMDPGHPLSSQLSPSEAHRLSRSEEHTSELQSLMRISYAVFCLKKKKKKTKYINNHRL